MSLQGKKIVLGVSGGIAVYKAAIICSQLKQLGAEIKVIMTKSATKFVQPLTFQTLSGHHVYTDTFEERDPSVVAHIDLADHADLFLIAPATANMIGKLASGLADDMLSTTLLATEAPIWIAPAMNGHMLQHPAVQDNIQKLKQRGVRFLQSGEGLLACGYVGQGRLLEPEQILAEVQAYFSLQASDKKSAVVSWWRGKHVLITAGPTREEIDPVRYLSNYSSGKMGYALAEVAVRYGAKVTLISGPVSISAPAGIAAHISIQTTDEMYEAVMAHYDETDVVIKAAAVADYQAVQIAPQKLKKAEEQMVLTLKKTKDILKALGEKKKKQLLIGFAAETTNVEEHALQKLKKKNLDFVVANNVSITGAGFGTDTNIVTIYGKNGQKKELPLQSKQEVARNILDMVAESNA